MIDITNIGILQPCHQSWQQMESQDSGRHCTHCSKTVVDFTKMTNSEIMVYLSVTRNVCGRFSQPQLNDVNQQVYQEELPVSYWRKKWIIAIGIFGSTMFFKVAAQTKPAVAQTTEQGEYSKPPQNKILGKVYLTDSARGRLIKGRILDENNTPISDAVVRVLPGNSQVITNIDGSFTLRITPGVTTLSVSYIGYYNKKLLVDNNLNAVCEIKLQPTPVVMGEVVIIKTPKAPFFKRMYYKFIKRPIRKLFR